MPVEALLTHAPTYSSQWMAALVAALPQIIIDLPIYTMIYDGFLSTDRHLFCVPFITSLKSNICKTLTTYNATKEYIHTQTQNTTALSPNVFLTAINFTGDKQGAVGFPHCNQI